MRRVKLNSGSTDTKLDRLFDYLEIQIQKLKEIHSEEKEQFEEFKKKQ